MSKDEDDTAERKRALATFVNFMRAYDRVRARLEPELTRHGVTPTQFGVLEAVYHLGPRNQKEIGRKILSSQGNLTTVIDNLERDRLVVRKPVPEDRRQNSIHLTVDGRRLVEKVFPLQASAIEREFGVLSPEEQETFRALCRKLGRGRED